MAITTLPFKFVPDEAPSYKQQLLESEEVPSLDFSKEALATALAEPVFTKVNVTFDAKRDHIANEILTSEQIYLEKLLTLNFVSRLCKSTNSHPSNIDCLCLMRQRRGSSVSQKR